MKNNTPDLLDLCGGTGSWSKPYVAAGYKVLNVTLPEYDVRLWNDYRYYNNNLRGILAAPPCTMFAISGARWKRTDAQMIEALSIVDACIRIIHYFRERGLVFDVLENPVGKLKYWLGEPVMRFQPWEYGDPWTKKTCLWGKFNIPLKTPVAPVGQWTGRCDAKGIVDHYEYLPPDWVHKLPPSPNRALLRSVTPPGFAKAFFEANP